MHLKFCQNNFTKKKKIYYHLREISPFVTFILPNILYKTKLLPDITRRQILDSSKLKEFADDNFKFDKNGKKVLKTDRQHYGKRRNCSLRAISRFPTVFSKGLFPRGVKRCHFVGMG